MGILNKIFRHVSLITLCCCFPVIVSAQTATIPLKSLPPNSRVALWGDSITEVTLYPRYIEIYLLACAGRKDIRVCTFGHSGETLNGLISRQTDMEAFKPTVVSFLYGMNDTRYSPYTTEKGATFDKTMRAVLTMLTSKGIAQRIVAGPTAVSDGFKADNFFQDADPMGLTAAQSQNVTLGHFRDIGRAAAIDTGSAFADLHNRMLDAYNRAKTGIGAGYEFGPVHPFANGHLMIAYEILKALDCNSDIGTLEVDMKAGARASAGHTIVSAKEGVVTLDSHRYPFCYNYDPNASKDATGLATIVPYLPFSQDLNRLMLRVSHLDAPTASITWGSQTRQFSREQLASGINLAAQFDQTPFDTTFARVMQAIGNKQEFENYMIKGTSNYFGNDNGGNFDENMIEIDGQMDAAVKQMLLPVRHTISIVPLGASETVPPIITGIFVAYATAGQPFQYQVSALHSPTRFSGTNLPTGLTIDPTTGAITGTPSEPGTRSILLTATNAQGDGKATLTLVVTPALPDRPAITSPETASATVGQPFSYQIVATNSPTHYFATSPGTHGTVPPASSLPPGIRYNTHTGLLSGIPTTLGIFPIQLAAMNRAGVTTKLITLTIKAQ